MNRGARVFLHNLGYSEGYTSYDYGAAIAEDRTVTREKYSEAKLEANFLMASPAYLTAVPGNVSNGSFVNTNEIATTPLVGNVTSFYVVRQAAYNNLGSTDYTLTVPTSAGNITIPQLSPTLTLTGRDSKIHVTDYDLGGINLLYSSAEIFTWKKYSSKTVLILYGGLSETHEAAFAGCSNFTLFENADLLVAQRDGALVVNWPVTAARKIIQIEDDLFVYLLDRNDAYNYWVLDLPAEPAQSPADNFTLPIASSVIVRAGYLLRTASITDCTLSLTGDINSTTSIEVVGGAPSGCSTLEFNGLQVASSQDQYGVLTGNVTYIAPMYTIPTLTDLEWKFIDSLPEIQSTYDDSAWSSADLSSSNNPRNLTTPTSLYASDYGYFTGNLLYRGHFTATGDEATLYLETQGGTAYGASVWLNSTLLGSWPGISIDANYNQTLALPSLTPGQPAVITVLLDTMGLEENGEVGTDEMKEPRGILAYALSGRPQSAITWKVTGNLGGEDYRDKARGPLNEGGLYAERQGYHLPNPPTADWTISSPTSGVGSAGVGFYTTNFNLSMPLGYDIPMSFNFANTTLDGSIPSEYRCQLYVNGYQFGKYVNNIGPQTSFPVPEGILNYHGINYIALSLWAFNASGAKVEEVELHPTALIQSGYGPVELSPMPAYTPRPGAY